MSNDFYPHHGPKKYSYTSAFGAENNRQKTAAQAKANTSYPGIGSPTYHKSLILYNLQVIIDGARRAELAFLSQTGIDLSSGNMAQLIMKNFNLILNSQALFERNLQMLRQLSEGKEYKLIDPSKYFFTYVNQAVQKMVIDKKFNIRKATGPQLEAKLEHIMNYAIDKTFVRFTEALDKQGNRYTIEGKAKGDEIALSSMHEMVSVIRKLIGTGIFKKYASILRLEETLLKNTNKQGKLQKPPFTKNSFDQGGTILEMITSTIGAEFAKIHQTQTNSFMGLTITGENTGGGNYNEQKGDTIIAYSKGTVNFKNMENVFKQHMGDGSKRLQNIDAFAEFLNKFASNIEHLLVISDKNTAISAKFEGAHAQDEMSLKNAQPMLEKFGVYGVEDLINYLANCGSGMIQGESMNGMIRQRLASYIAYFLFDHVEISGKIHAGTNVVNILNLGGTYIPLSVFLESAYKTIDARLNNIGNVDNMVRVSFSPGGEVPDGEWTESLWDTYRNNRLQDTTLEYHFMKDIASYITGLMS